ncbi:MAG: hypothetical protein ACI9OJ_003435 [Myxococcota bacterium]|jgi:hypothetical protein
MRDLLASRAGRLANPAAARHHPSMVTRANKGFRPGLRIQAGSRVLFGQSPTFDGEHAFVRAPGSLSTGANLRCEWTGPGRIFLDATVEDQSDTGPDERRLVRLRIQRVTSAESTRALEHFMRAYLRRTEWADVSQAGATWSVTIGLSEGPVPQAEFRGPAPRVAGIGATVEAPPPLDTGKPETTVARLRTYFDVSAESKVGMYLNIPTSYSVAGAQYWGRALRINDRWLQINTSSVLPGLGVRMRADLTTTVDGDRRPVSIFGVMSRRAEALLGGTFKATLSLRINRIDEGDSPGLLLHFLELIREAKAQRDEDGP